MRRISLCTLAVFTALVGTVASGPTTAWGQNLLSDPGFETGLVSGCGQSLLPNTWFNTPDKADVHSFNCSILNGLDPVSWNNFTGLPAANDGLRFVAGGTVPGVIEAFGQTLGAPLIPGCNYRLRGYFTISHSHIKPGVFDIYLSPTTAWPLASSATFVGSIGFGAVQDSWRPDSLEFTAPEDAATLPNIFMVPRTLSGSPDSYMGTDSWSLTWVVGECPTAAKGTSWGQLKTIYR